MVLTYLQFEGAEIPIESGKIFSVLHQAQLCQVNLHHQRANLPCPGSLVPLWCWTFVPMFQWSFSLKLWLQNRPTLSQNEFSMAMPQVCDDDKEEEKKEVEEEEEEEEDDDDDYDNS